MFSRWARLLLRRVVVAALEGEGLGGTIGSAVVDVEVSCSGVTFGSVLLAVEGFCVLGNLGSWSVLVGIC